MNSLLLMNSMSNEDLAAELKKCCGSAKWVTGMLAQRPFRTMGDVLAKSQRVWWDTDESDALEAFSHHPKIGDVDSLRQKFLSTANLASEEQAGVTSATEETLQALAVGNEAYEKKNGFIFIVCATGKSASEILALLNARLLNDRATELKNARNEQEAITEIRLKKFQGIE